MTPAFGSVIARSITSVIALFIITSRISTTDLMATPTLFHRSMAAGTRLHMPPIRTELEVILRHLTVGAIRLRAS